MITPRKRIANRRNAQKSSGPKTEDGKRRSAVNAMQHGLSIPLVRSRWIDYLDAVARMLMDEDSFDEAEAYALASSILEYERVIAYQRERILMDIDGKKPEVQESGLAGQSFELAHTIGAALVAGAFDDNEKELYADMRRFASRVGRRELKSARREMLYQYNRADRYLRRAANQLIKQCRNVSSHYVP